MFDASPYAFLIFAACVLLATGAGLALSRCMPWSDDARQVGLARAVGVALGPFLFGMACVLALGILRGAAHSTHLTSIFVLLACIGAGGYWLARGQTPQGGFKRHAFNAAEWLIISSIIFAVAALLFITLFLPLTQNDALEYALAARELFATRDLLSYPVLNPETNLTGFFGPWTHPPLYVAMLYMAEVMQGHADAPGLIRLISPWFMLSGAFLTYALGSYVNRTVGLLACLVFLSPPLFFLGAGSALLDPLPVLGFTLIIAAAVGLRARPLVFGAIIGSLLGLALWTHSQAILFIPLALAAIGIERGLRDWRGLAAAATALLCVAILIGAWPYWRNMELFGSPISDNPAVIAMPALHWDDYFSINRGLNNTTAMIQYGIFKGWFALEAYGFIFWGMTVGIVFFLGGQIRFSIRRLALDGVGATRRNEAALWLMAGLMIIYILGVILSVALGIDHMVKNERYLLVTLPVVAVFCAYGYMRLMQKIMPQVPIAAARLVSVLIAAIFTQVILLTYYAGQKGEQGVFWFETGHDERLSKFPEYKLIKYIDELSGWNGIVLSMKPSDMYYSDTRMISYLDERLLPFYTEKDHIAAYQKLIALGVTQIHLPNYGIPPLYNSALYMISRDPRLTTLEMQSAAGQVYSLHPERLVAGAEVDITPGVRQWIFDASLQIGGRKGFAKAKRTSHPLRGSAYHAGLPWNLFHRDWISGINTGVPDSEDKADRTNALAVSPSTQYAFDVSVEGAGFVKITINQYSGGAGEIAKFLNAVPMASFEMSQTQSHRNYGFRFLTDPSTTNISILIESVGSSFLKINNVTYHSLTKSL